MKIKNFDSNGYTLIEFVMVMIVVSVIGVLIISILSSTLRGTKKSDLISTIRTSGNQAITQMAKLMKFSKEFKGVSVDGDPTTYVLDCTNLVADPTPTPVPYKYLQFIGEDENPITFKCNDAAGTIESNGTSLIDETVVKVANDKCWFICSQNRATINPVVKIYFELRQTKDTTFAESQFSIPFETSVVLRNLVR